MRRAGQLAAMLGRARVHLHPAHRVRRPGVVILGPRHVVVPVPVAVIVIVLVIVPVMGAFRHCRSFAVDSQCQPL